MQLVGATKGFIARPLVAQGIMKGIYGGVIACSLLSTVIYFAQQQVPDIFVIQQDIEMIALLYLVVLLTGLAISWISTSLSVRKYLRLKLDDLYEKG